MKLKPLQHSPESSPTRGTRPASDRNHGTSVPRGSQGYWFWSNATIPSTHILKPGDPHRFGVEENEAASMLLASLCGVPTPHAGIVSFEGQTSYIVERFDRARNADGTVRRAFMPRI